MTINEMSFLAIGVSDFLGFLSIFIYKFQNYLYFLLIGSSVDRVISVGVVESSLGSSFHSTVSHFDRVKNGH
jgi:hypothetical protein